MTNSCWTSVIRLPHLAASLNEVEATQPSGVDTGLTSAKCIFLLEGVQRYREPLTRAGEQVVAADLGEVHRRKDELKPMTSNHEVGSREATAELCRQRRTPPVHMRVVLEMLLQSTHTIDMSTKQIVQDLLQRLPENVSLHDVAKEIEFIAAVREGLDELDRGERIPIEDIERELPSWVIR